MKNTRIITIAIVTCMSLVVVGAVVGVLTSKKPLELYNIDQVDSGLSSREIAELEGYIWESLQRTQGFETDKQEIIALVRPSSFVRKVEGEVESYEFLIDIDEFKATYEVSFALLSRRGFYEAPMVDCPAPELMKYPETVCRGEKTSMLSVTVGRELPYYFDLDTGELVTVTRGVDNTGEEYLNVRVSSCGNQVVVNKAQDAVEGWIEDLGYEPADYKIVVPEFCDGGAG